MNQGILGCVWFICRKMELHYWLVNGNMKNNNKLVEQKVFVDAVTIKSVDLENKFLF